MLKTMIHDRPEESMRRWRVSGLTASPLMRAVRAGYLSRISRTANDAPIAAGFYHWNETLRTLRDELVVLGWNAGDEQMFSTILSPDAASPSPCRPAMRRQVAHVEFPRTKRDKGRAQLM